MTFVLSDAEVSALKGLTWTARLAYVFGLRPYMDYATGVVGRERGVSWRSIAEELYVEPHQGIKGGAPSEKELRRAIEWLERRGLVERDKQTNMDKRELVFFLPLAASDKSVRKKVGSKWADQLGRDMEGLEAAQNLCFKGNEGSKVEGSETQKVGTHPVSGIYISTTSVVESDDADAPPFPEDRKGRKEPPQCPHDEIINLYHEILPMCPRVREWNKQRQGYLRQRWRENMERQNINWWRQYFEYCAQSRFLIGKAKPRTPDELPFLADLEWLIRPKNFTKVIEGKYHRDQAA